jgi:hypothetical protein
MAGFAGATRSAQVHSLRMISDPRSSWGVSIVTGRGARTPEWTCISL